jgi:iron complex outermembrane receptor protein
VDDVVRVSVADVQPELFDMERVEVLKGPQGTLFGRNSIGGVVSMYTKQPTFHKEGSTEVTYGEHNLFELKGMFNTPLIDDKLALRVALTSTAVNGNVSDITTGADLGAQHRLGARVKLLLTPSADFKFVTTFDYLRTTSTNATWLQGNFQPALVPDLTFGPEKTAQTNSGMGWLRNWGLSGRADWSTGIGTLTSITGYRHLRSDEVTSVTADPADLVLAEAAERDHQFTQELRFASPVDQPFTWIVGAYYLNSQKQRALPTAINFLPGSILSLISAFPPQYSTMRRRACTRSARRRSPISHTP